MPDLDTFKLEGRKLVPLNRFNLEPSKPSNSFFETTIKTPIFTVIEHPIIHSIAIDPVIIATILDREYFPLINDSQTIDENTAFKDYEDNKTALFFPELEILPSNNTLFYYENVLDTKGNNAGLLGKVTLKYSIKNKPLQTNEKAIVVNLKEAILNLKTEKETIKINGIVNLVSNEIVFNLKDEAVKIAFSNLVTNISELKCGIDLFLDFKGYSKVKKQFQFANNIMAIKNTRFATNVDHLLIATTTLESPLIVKSNINRTINASETIRNIRVENGLDVIAPQENYIKSTFLLRINKTVNYPLSTDIASSLYKTVDGGFINNPFNLNNNFSQFKQLFITGVNFNELSVYKSTIQPDTFLLISKKYCLSRDLNTMKPAITTVLHATEDDSGLSEDISKIEFLFAIGPSISEYDLAKLKISLKNNGFLDNNNYQDNIQFLYPNDIETNFEISGNYFLNQADVATDGKHFIFNLKTEFLNDASLLINSLNNSISQYANINFIHKEISDTSIIDLNIEKTIGEILNIAIDNGNKKINIRNQSITKCKLNSILCIDQDNNGYFNNDFFQKYPLLNSNQEVIIDQILINPDNKNLVVNKAYFDYESVEDISLEFTQIVSKSTDYNRYIQIKIKKQSPKVFKIQIELIVNKTANRFNVEKLKLAFNVPLLFNFIIKNDSVIDTKIFYKTTYFDSNDNIIETKEATFDYATSSILTIIKHK